MKKLFLLLFFSSLICGPLAPAVPDPLEVWYEGYNAALFNHELPDKIVIGHDLHDDRFMALTDYDNGVYRIEFNPKYGPSPKQERMTLLHEQCHMRQMVSGEVEFDDHGEKWQSCMHDIANENGFNNLW